MKRHSLLLLVLLLLASQSVLAQVKSVTVTPLLLEVGQKITCTVVADSSGTATIDSEPVTWNSVEQEWDFGDGDLADTLVAEHTFIEAGEYFVTSFTTFLLDGDPVSFEDRDFTVTVTEVLPKKVLATYRETWSLIPKKVTTREFGDSFTEVLEPEKGSFTLTGLVSLESLTEPLSADTDFGLSAGNVDIFGTLGDLGEAMGGTGTFRNGRANGKLTEDIGEDREKLITVQTLVVTYNAKQLNFRLTGKLHPTGAGSTLAADDYDESGPVEVPVTLTLGTLELTIPITGQAKVKVVTKRFKIDGDIEEWDATTKTLTGKYSYTDKTR
jgi:hypothetical protein